MKKTLLIIGIVFCSIVGFSQKASLPVQETPISVKRTSSPEERISRLEAEIKSLKTEQVEIKKQLSELQSSLPAADGKKKKLIIKRAGSKQVNWSLGEKNEK